MKKSDQLKKTYDEIKAKIDNLQEEGKTKEAFDLLPELKNAEQAYKVQMELEKDERDTFFGGAQPLGGTPLSNAAMRNRIFNKGYVTTNS